MRGMSLERIARACNGTLVLPLPLEQSLTEASIQNKEKTGSIAGSENVKSVCERKVCPETEITSAVLDSRKVTEGALFFATVGERVDGHKFVPSVFEKEPAARWCKRRQSRWKQSKVCLLSVGVPIFW